MAKTPKSRTNDALRQSHLAWLAGLEEFTGLTATELARGADLDPSTLTRFKSEARRTLSGLTIRQLSTRWQYHRQPGEDQRAPGLSEEAVPYKAGSEGTALDTALRALKSGRNNCDAWTVRSRTLEAIGYLPGDVVLVDLSAEPRDGDAVLAQIYDFDRMKAVTVWRRYHRHGTLQLLVAASFDPNLGEPVLVNGKDVAIKGVVLGFRLRGVDKAA